MSDKINRPGRERFGAAKFQLFFSSSFGTVQPLNKNPLFREGKMDLVY